MIFNIFKIATLLLVGLCWVDGRPLLEDPVKQKIDLFVQEANFKDLCLMEQELENIKGTLSEDGQNAIDEHVQYIAKQAGNDYVCTKHDVETSVVTTTTIPPTTTDFDEFENPGIEIEMATTEETTLGEIVEYDDTSSKDFDGGINDDSGSMSNKKIKYIVILTLIAIGLITLITLFGYGIYVCVTKK